MLFQYHKYPPISPAFSVQSEHTVYAISSNVASRLFPEEGMQEQSACSGIWVGGGESPSGTQVWTSPSKQQEASET